MGTTVSVTCERMWLPHCVAPRPLLARYTPQLVRLAQGPHLCGSKHNSRHCCVMSIGVYACKLVNTARSGFLCGGCAMCDGCSAVRWTFPPFAGEHPWTADTFFCFISSCCIGQRVFDSGLVALALWSIFVQASTWTRAGAVTAYGPSQTRSFVSPEVPSDS